MTDEQKARYRLNRSLRWRESEELRAKARARERERTRKKRGNHSHYSLKVEEVVVLAGFIYNADNARQCYLLDSYKWHERKHKYVFNTIRTLIYSGSTVDETSVCQLLDEFSSTKHGNTLEYVGGIPFFKKLRGYYTTDKLFQKSINYLISKTDETRI